MNSETAIRLFVLLVVFSTSKVWGHDWHPYNDGPAENEDRSREHSSSKDDDDTSVIMLTSFRSADEPEVAGHFSGFKNVETRWDASHLYIESNAIPNHNMMVGIRNWQQQVPLPQPFTGNNAWKIPLKPRLSDDPISVRRNPLRGAIAIAVNGVPIFCALNNRGEDSYLLGELDQWGGHCGRGDDYHYHIAPVHLEEVVGKGNPIGYALDGFPIYGLTEEDGSAVGKLDQYNGQFDKDGNYHYHATKSFPYINGGLRGVVTIRGDQVEQPRDSPVRPGMPPLRGAKITDFETNGNQRVLTYTVQGRTGKISYSPQGSNAWKFVYTDPRGGTRTETYQRRAPREDQKGGPPPPRNGRPRRGR